MAVYFLILIILLCGSSNAQFLKSSIRMLQRNSDEKKRLRAAKRRQRLEKKRLKQLAREREKTEDDRQKKTSMTFNPSKIQEHQKEDDVFKNTVPVDETTTPSPISGKALSCSKTERHPKRFTIQLCNMSNLTAFDNAFVKAASRWESVITEKLPDIQRSTQDDFDLFAGQLGDRKVNIDVDDIVIGFDFRESSGVGSGGFLWMRSESFGGLPFSGRIILNSNVFKPESLDQQTATEYMLHELGHVLGIGTYWNTDRSSCQGKCRRGEMLGAYGCHNAEREYQELRLDDGSKDLLLSKDCAHWDDTSFPTFGSPWSEVMTPTFRSDDIQLLTRVSVGALEDIGYSVDYSKADPIPS